VRHIILILRQLKGLTPLVSRIMFAKDSELLHRLAIVPNFIMRVQLAAFA
jgi:hypothetical protein